MRRVVLSSSLACVLAVLGQIPSGCTDTEGVLVTPVPPPQMAVDGDLCDGDVCDADGDTPPAPDTSP